MLNPRVIAISICVLVACACTAAPSGVPAIRLCGFDLNAVEFKSADGKSQQAIAVVKKYWATNYAARYALFSNEYKGALKRAFGISDAAGYSKRMINAYFERIWSAARVIAVQAHDVDHVTVTVLVCWEQAGYTGFDGVVFDIARYDSGWLITNIVD